MTRSIFIGFDPREIDAFGVLGRSLIRHASPVVPFEPLVMDDLFVAGLYGRPHEFDGHVLWDTISASPMSTQFAFTRFLTPHLARARGDTGWALFMDCDMLVRADMNDLFALADPRFAVQVVKHPSFIGAGLKMDGQPQTHYAKKCWSSLMLFNLDHYANLALNPYSVSNMTGRQLHQFEWLPEHLVGDLPPEWNWMPGVSQPIPNPKIVHYTLGVPTMPGCENVPFADEWRADAQQLPQLHLP